MKCRVSEMSDVHNQLIWIRRWPPLSVVVFQRVGSLIVGGVCGRVRGLRISSPPAAWGEVRPQALSGPLVRHALAS